MSGNERIISRRTTNALKDFLSSRYTVATIRQLFDAEGIDYDENVEEGYQGARRTEAERYLSTLDLGNPRDAEKLTKVLETVLLIDRREGPGSNRELTALQRGIEADGFRVVGKRLIRGGTAVSESVEEVVNRLSLNYVRDEWERALREVDSDPADAITAACALLESTCKAILDKLGLAYPTKQDIQHLYREAADALSLSPQAAADPELRRVLGGASNVVSGIGVIRTRHGDAHGRGERDTILEPRHSRLAVQLAGATAVFLVESLEIHLRGRKDEDRVENV